jgi:hypothetical protein
MVVGTQLCCEWPHATTSTISAGQVLIQEWKPHVTHYLYSVLRLVMDTNHFRHTRYAVRIVAIVEATGAGCQCETDILDRMHVLQTDLLPRNARLHPDTDLIPRLRLEDEFHSAGPGV